MAEALRLRELMQAVGRRRCLRDPIASMCEELQLTPPQVHALLWLGVDGTLAMGELARRLGITEKTVTGLVDRLEREGHLQRERDEGDRRVVHCRLTATGTQLFQKVDRVITQGVAHFLGLLDPEDRRALFRLLENLGVRMQKPAAEADCPSSKKDPAS